MFMLYMRVKLFLYKSFFRGVYLEIKDIQDKKDTFGWDVNNTLQIVKKGFLHMSQM